MEVLMNTYLDISPEVRAALDKVIVVKIMAEHPGNPVTKALLDQFDVAGLPAFVLLQPASGE